MNKDFMNELKRLGQEMNDLEQSINEDTKKKTKIYNVDMGTKYNIMKSDLEELQQLASDAKIQDIMVKIPCDFYDKKIKAFMFWFPGTSYANQREVGLNILFGDYVSEMSAFAGWLYNWCYSRSIIKQEEGRWTHKYYEKIFNHIINDWEEIKTVIEKDFTKEYKLKLADKVQIAINKNEDIIR